MKITNITADVRVVNYGSPFSCDEDIVVEERKPTDVPGHFTWHRAWGTNSLSNDYAHSEAMGIARSLAQARLYA